MADVVWLKWINGGVVYKACHASVAGAQGQAAAEGTLIYLGIFDGPEDDSKKLADIKTKGG